MSGPHWNQENSISLFFAVNEPQSTFCYFVWKVQVYVSDVLGQGGEYSRTLHVHRMGDRGLKRPDRMEGNGGKSAHRLLIMYVACDTTVTTKVSVHLDIIPARMNHSSVYLNNPHCLTYRNQNTLIIL